MATATTIDATETVTGILAAIGEDRGLQATEALGAAMMTAILTFRAEATEIESARTDTRDATGAIGSGIAIGVGAGMLGETTTTGL